MNWNVVYYKTNSGKVPVIEYIVNLKPVRIKKIRNALRLKRELEVAIKRMKDYIGD